MTTTDTRTARQVANDHLINYDPMTDENIPANLRTGDTARSGLWAYAYAQLAANVLNLFHDLNDPHHSMLAHTIDNLGTLLGCDPYKL